MITKTCLLTSGFFYPEKTIGPINQVLFFDIETTGFISTKSNLYLIGAAFFRDGSWQLVQWLAERPEEESLLLKTFQEFTAPFSTLVHFNGDTFDLPFLRKKAQAYGLMPYLESIKSVDLLRMLRPAKKLLGLSHMNQTALETFLGISREDHCTGQELISVYQSYTDSPDPALSFLLLLHNHDDVQGMLNLLPMLTYPLLLKGNFTVSGCEPDQEDAHSFSLVFHLLLSYPLPKPFSLKLESGYLHGKDEHARILVCGIKGTLKHFFPNYRDYYYLPVEDTAVHKSVGAYVDREHRIPAKASTCYCKKTGAFLPNPEADPALAFKTDYADIQTYQECTPEFLHDLAALQQYASNFMHFSL